MDENNASEKPSQAPPAQANEPTQPDNRQEPASSSGEGGGGQRNEGGGRRGRQRNFRQRRNRRFRDDRGGGGSREGGGGGSRENDGPADAGVPIEGDEPAGDPVFEEGIVEVSGKGFGFLRNPKRNFTQSNNDVFVTPEVVRAYNLRDGVWIKGEIRKGSRGDGRAHV